MGFGRFWALVSATLLGLNTTFARLAYDGGSNAITVVTFRCLLAIVATAILVAALRQSMRLSAGAWLPVIGSSLGLTVTSVCYLAAASLIPVGLAALLFYTYPLMVAAGRWGRDDGPSAVIFVVAFAGLALSLGPSLEDLDWRGIALALMAATGAWLMFHSAARAVRHRDPMTVSLLSNVGCLPIVAGATFFMGGPAIPVGAAAWAGFMGASVCFAVAVLTVFIAIRMAGQTASALLMNLEPLVSIIAAAIFLGERLTMLQYLGASLVLMALLFSGRIRTRPG
jgi:drug/metabolite transporter (DMT)-like permease